MLPIATTAHDLLASTVAAPPYGMVPMGRVFWVDYTNGSDALGTGAFNDTLKTIAGAIAKCVTGRGDLVLVKPGYSELLGASDTITISIDDVSVVGLGKNRKRPKLQFDSDAASVVISGDRVSLINIAFKNSVSAHPLLVNVTGDNFLAHRLVFTIDAVGDEVDTSILLASSDDSRILNCEFLYGNMITPFADDAINLTGTCERTVIRKNFIYGNFTASAINGGAGDDFLIEDNVIVNTDTGTEPILDLGAGAEGLVRNNLGQHGQAALTAAMDEADCAMAENYFTNDVTKSGAIYPATRST